MICKICKNEIAPSEKKRGRRVCRACYNKNQNLVREKSRLNSSPKEERERKARQNIYYKLYKKKYPDRVALSKEVANTKRLKKMQRHLDFCVDCGEDDLRILVFHHKNPDEKIGSIANVISSRNWREVRAEIEKCDVLCHNCHAKKHYYIDKDGIRRRK